MDARRVPVRMRKCSSLRSYIGARMTAVHWLRSQAMPMQASAPLDAWGVLCTYTWDELGRGLD